MTDSERVRFQIQTILTLCKIQYDPHPERQAKVLDQLVSYLISNGTTNILDLVQYKNPAANLTFFFDKTSAHVYPRPGGRPDNLNFVDGPFSENLFYGVNLDEYRTNYFIFLVFTPDGYPVFYSRGEYTGSDWHDFFQGVLFVASVVVAYAYPQLATSIGTAVMGTTAAAAYPAVAAAIGNAAVGAALNGGDVGAAVENAMVSVAAGGVGNVAAAASDSAMIGRVAASATAAAITGGDITNAVATSLIRSGIQATNAGQLFTPQENVVPTKQLGDFDYLSFDDPGNTNDYGNIVTGAGGTDYGVQPTEDNPYGIPSIADMSPGGAASNWWGSAANIFTTPVNLNPSNLPPAGPSGVVANAGGVDLTQLAMTGLKLVQAWNQAGKPAPRIGSASSHPNANGTLTQNIGGRVITGPMPVGTPYLMANGSLVTNNGDGTYTTVFANGTVTTTRYAATGLAGLGASLTSNPMLLAGVGLFALLLVMKKGR